MKKKKVLLVLAMAVITVGCAAGCGKQEVAQEASETVAEATERIEPTEMVLAQFEAETEESTEELIEEVWSEEPEEESGVAEMSAAKYAKSAVNVRSGAGVEYDRLGGLTANQKVTVTGQADNGWYRIDYNGKDGFVSDKYLVDENGTIGASSSGKKAEAANKNGTGVGNNSKGNSGATANSVANGNTAEGSASTPSAPTPAPTPDAGNNGGSGNNGGGQPAPSTPEQPAPTPAPTPEQPAPAPDAENNGGGNSYGGMQIPEGVEPPNENNIWDGAHGGADDGSPSFGYWE